MNKEQFFAKLNAPLKKLPAQEREDILRQDPRPGYQNDPEREYKLDYGGWKVRFKVQSTMDEGQEAKDKVIVTEIRKEIENFSSRGAERPG